MTTTTTVMKRPTFLPFAAPSLGPEEIREVVDTLRSPWITTGPKARRFETDFCEHFDAPDAIAFNSCTAAMHTALLAHGIGPGDEVLTTPLTFIATFNVIEHVGARPVLVDVEPGPLTIDPLRLDAAITPRTRAVIPVHYAGHPVDLDAIRTLAERNGLTVVEDAAHAVAAKYRGRSIGSGDNPAAFSFYATKNLTTGEGGMLTGAGEWMDRARVIRIHGITRDAWRRYDRVESWSYSAVLPGYKYNMSDVHASIGIGQLRRLAAFQQRRRQIVDAYQLAFSDHEAFEVPVEHADVVHAWHLYVLRLRPETLRIDRDAFIRELNKRNIGASVHFIPVHLHEYARRTYGWSPMDYPVAYENYLRMLSLPLYPAMTDRDAYDVIDAVLDIAEEFRR